MNTLSPSSLLNATRLRFMSACIFACSARTRDSRSSTARSARAFLDSLESFPLSIVDSFSVEEVPRLGVEEDRRVFLNVLKSSSRREDDPTAS